MSEVLELAFCLLDLSFLLTVEHGDDCLFAGEFVVEVGDVVNIGGQFRDKWRLSLFGRDFLLVEIFEPGVREDLVESTFAAESLGGILH